MSDPTHQCLHKARRRRACDQLISTHCPTLGSQKEPGGHVGRVVGLAEGVGLGAGLAEGAITRLMVTEAELRPSLPVTVYTVFQFCVGVPDITPVAELNHMPAGTADGASA